MAQGGARTRSGPSPTEGSARSESRGYSLTALPAEGFTGEVPDFPLPSPIDRELELWADVWRTPQACAWALPSERWRIRTVAMWVRVSVRCEDPHVSPPTLAQMHRLADQVGLTTAGLAEMGWKVAVDQVAERSAREPAAEPRSRRLRVAGDAG